MTSEEDRKSKLMLLAKELGVESKIQKVTFDLSSVDRLVKNTLNWARKSFTSKDLIK